MAKELELNEKIAVVTGGSNGIGAAVVHRLLDEGASVYSLDINESPFSDEYTKKAEKTGAFYSWIYTDVSDPESTDSVMDRILGEGQIDILVNNAGITRDALIFRMKDADWDAVLRINLTAVFRMCRKVSRPMIKQRSGSIVNIASIVGMIGNAGQTNYSASKAGVIGLSKSLAKEVASRGVRVNAVAPGYIDTSMTKSLKEDQRKALTDHIALQRIGKPEEIAEAVLFLASDRASYITGQVLPVDGGLTM